MNNTIIKDPTLEPFYISKDKYCYTVIELITPTRTRGSSTKQKEPYEKSIGHYTHINHALKAIAKGRLTSPPKLYNSIKDYLSYYEEINKELETLLNKMDI
jgi:hypothetical protein